MLELLATGTKLVEPTQEEKTAELLLLLEKVAKKNGQLFKTLFSKDKECREAIKSVLMMSQAQAINFQYSLHLSLNQRRLVSTLFRDMWGFSPIPPDKNLAAFEAACSEHFTTDNLERGQMLLLKSQGDSVQRKCYFARVRNVPSYLRKEVEAALGEVFDDPVCIQNLASEKYEGRLRLTVGGDKGGDCTKITIMLGGGREPLVIGMFMAADIHANMLTFFDQILVQLRNIKLHGMVVRHHTTGLPAHMECDILINGDMGFISEAVGHSGGGGMKPSYYRLVSRDHLQWGHRNGEPHIPGRPECEAPWRDMREMERQYLANERANVTPKLMAKHAKKFGSLKGMMLVPLESPDFIVPSGLHYSLEVGKRLAKLLETEADSLDRGEEEAAVMVEDEAVPCEEEDSDNESDGVGSGQLGAGPSSELLETSGQQEAQREAAQRQEVLAAKAEAEEEHRVAEVRVAECERVVEVKAEKLTEVAKVQKRIAISAAATALPLGTPEASTKWKELEELARQEARVRRPRVRHDFCSPTCLLTVHDRNIKWERCSGCGSECHSVCELWGLEPAAPVQPNAIVEEGEEEQEEEQQQRLCKDCKPQPVLSYLDMGAALAPRHEQLDGELVLARVELERARAELARCGEVLDNWRGRRRKELQYLMEVRLRVVKTAWQGGSYVGRHVEKILENHVLLSSVLADRPDRQALFVEFCSSYLTVHCLMKAARWLTEDEVSY